MKYIIFTLRILIGLLFIEAAYIKITQPEVFAEAIRGYRLIPDTYSSFFAVIIPWIELVLGLNLVGGAFLKTTSLLSALIVLFFTLIVVYALISGLDIDCGCGVSLVSSAEVSWIKVAENMLLTIFLFLVFSRKSYFGALENKFHFLK